MKIDSKIAVAVLKALKAEGIEPTYENFRDALAILDGISKQSLAGTKARAFKKKSWAK